MQAIRLHVAIDLRINERFANASCLRVSGLRKSYAPLCDEA